MRAGLNLTSLGQISRTFSPTRDAVLSGTVLIAGLVWGCNVSNPCGPDEELDDDRFVCAPLSVEAPDVQESDADEEADMCTEGGYGNVCFDEESHSDCDCGEADFCAIQPGNTQGFCTRIDCLEDGEGCPPSFLCFDLATIAPELGSMCVQL